ncbi:MAG TPA: CapA family protein, partial [Clostridia bacterium]|nr:CapA family protein [Clostridia bacterium]
MNKSRIKVLILIFILTLTLIMPGCSCSGSVQAPTQTPTKTSVNTPVTTPTQSNTPTQPATTEPSIAPVTETPTIAPSPSPSGFDESTLVKIKVVGDVMNHSTNIEGAKTDTGYDYKPWFEDIRYLLTQGDLVIANLETTLNGRTNPQYTGYPLFNTPAEILEGLKYAGINFLITSNNHSFDSGYDGVKNTIAEIRDAGLDYIGTYLDRESFNTPYIKEYNGIKIGFVSYTYGTNGYSVLIPSDKLPYTIRYIDYDEPKKMYKDIADLKEAGAELVIVSLHWGVEYEPEPNYQQRKLAQNLFEHGADLIIGGHPHCVQRVAKRTIQTVDGQTKECVVTYSLGNFIADQ